MPVLPLTNKDKILPAPRAYYFQADIRTTAQKQEAIQRAEFSKTMNRMYNTDQGWSFRILAGVGQASTIVLPEAAATKGISDGVREGDMSEILQAAVTYGQSSKVRILNNAYKEVASLPSTSPKFDPGKPALAKSNILVPASKNGYAPDFSETPYLYQTIGNQKNVVQIKLTGSYSSDFSAANQAANISGSKTPKGYVWHHMDDYNPSTGMSTIQLVKSDIHTSTIPHTGSVKQYEITNKTTYKQ